MRKLVLTYALIVLCITINAQEKMSYENNDNIIEFTVSQKEVYVEFESNQKTTIQNQSNGNIEQLTETSALLRGLDLSRGFQNQKTELDSKYNMKFNRIEPVLIYNNEVKQISTGEIIIKLKQQKYLNEIFKGYEFEYKEDPFVKNQFKVKLNIETSEIFNLVNKIQGDKRIEFAEPNFIVFAKLDTSDPYFGSQWAINNQGYLGGTVDADMDVSEAWAYSTGSGIKIAILDTGVELTHPDLASNLLTGLDATGNGSNGGPLYGGHFNNAHGTACAGIAAAVANNNNGIAGVAYDAKIIPVRIGYVNVSNEFIVDYDEIAYGINWAVNNGADILSNSYSLGSNSTNVNTAITNAVNNDCLVLFSSGNDIGGNGDSVSYPAELNNVIAVGATSMCDERKSLASCDGESWGSNYGNLLDIVSPGVQIYTTDLLGNEGYNTAYNGDYFPSFNGTSSACPNASGVAALIWSAKTSLTAQEVRSILESNTDKVIGYSYSTTSGHPNGTWNNEVGYGRVNGCKAVLQAYNTGNSIVGQGTICNTATYSLSNPPNADRITWASSNTNGLTINPTTGFATRQNNFNGQVTITATVSGGCGSVNVTRNVNVGNYLPIGTSSYNSNCSGNTFNILNTSLSSVCTANTPISFSYKITDSNYSNFVYTPVSVPSGATWSFSGGNLYMTVTTPPSQGSRSATIALTATGPCGTYNVNFTSTAVNIYSSFFTISPNPSQGNVTVSMENENLLNDGSQNLIYAIKITDLFGILGESFEYKAGINSVKIPLQNFNSGLYILSVFDGKIWSSERLIIQK